MDVGPDGRWRLDPAALADAVTPRTRAVLLNDPHNPTGAVLDAADRGRRGRRGARRRRG
jgi:arginine:pyruvate transaminase